MKNHLSRIVKSPTLWILTLSTAYIILFLNANKLCGHQDTKQITEPVELSTWLTLITIWLGGAFLICWLLIFRKSTTKVSTRNYAAEEQGL